MKRKYLSIYFPNWSINRIQKSLPIEKSHKGIFLTVRRNDQLIVKRRCELARRAGIEEESTLALARAFMPQAIITEFNPVQDFKSLYYTAVKHYCYSPLIGMDQALISAYKLKTLSGADPLHNGFSLDLTGTDKIHVSDHDLLKKCNKFFFENRIEVRMSVAPTLGLAWAMARFAAERVTITREHALAAAAKLPVESLRIEPKLVADLKDVGLFRIEDVVPINRASLFSRYGKSFLLRLDQMLGAVPESVEPIDLPNHWSKTAQYEYPLKNQEFIAKAIAGLLQEVFAELTEKKRSTKTFLLLLVGEYRAGGAFQQVKEFQFYSPAREEKHVLSVVAPLVETLDLPGAIHTIMLTAKNTVKAAADQQNIAQDHHAAQKKTELFDYLVSKLGRDNVTYPEFAASYVPEQSFKYDSVLRKDKLNSQCLTERRPPVILDTPLQIRAIAALPDSAPNRIFWNSKALDVLSSEGPERIEQPWFTDRNFKSDVRDYFRIKDQLGRMLWIYRETRSNQWYVHGMWI